MEQAFLQALDFGNGVFNCDDVITYICNKHPDFKEAIDNLAPDLNEGQSKIQELLQTTEENSGG